MKKVLPWFLTFAVAVCVPVQAEDKGAMLGEEAPVEMARMEVEAVMNRPWVYAKIPGCQVLSLAGKRETAGFLEFVRDEQAFFAKLVPEVKVPDSYPAFTVILQSPAFTKIRDVKGPNQVPFLSYLKMIEAGEDMEICLFGDEKTIGKSQLFQGETVNEHAAGFFREHYRARLFHDHRELPAWYREGASASGIIRSEHDGRVKIFHAYSLHRDFLRVIGLVGPDLPGVQIWPLEKFLTATPPEASAIALPKPATPEGNVYQGQSVLFFHWGLRGGGEVQRAAFRRFVAVACTRTVDEALFSECFGFGFAEGQRRFEEFIRKEVKAGLAEDHRGYWPKPGAIVKPNAARAKTGDHLTVWGHEGYDFLQSERSYRKKDKAPPIEVRPAQTAEIWRIMGETYLWAAANGVGVLSRVTPGRPMARYQPLMNDVLEGYVRVTTPEAKRFLSRARELMERLYAANGGGDPELLAVMGQLELTAGNHEKAEHLIQMAVNAGVARPAAYYILAQLRLDRLLAAEKTGEPRLGAEQLEPVRALLREALRRLPEMGPAYGTLAYAWRISGELPTADDLAILTHSVRLYPENVDATRTIAALCEKAGKHELAAELAKIGLAWLPRRVPEELCVELTELEKSGEKKPAQ